MSIDLLPPQLRPGGLLLFFMLFALLEMRWLHRRAEAGRGYDWRESGASTAIALGNALIRPFTAALLLPLFDFVHEHRLFDWKLDAARFALLLVAVDFVYYGFHRANHRVRWLWATHSVHHSTTRFNLSAAYRLGWTDLLAGAWLFVLGFVWLGVPPAAATGAFVLNLAFQFFLHTEAVGRLGPLEWIFNTPTHHRVHHACNESLLDKNFGGVLIVWDRLFGTYATTPEHEALRFGLGHTSVIHNPLRIAFGEWRRLLADMRKAGSLRRAVRQALAPPG